MPHGASYQHEVQKFKTPVLPSLNGGGAFGGTRAGKSFTQAGKSEVKAENSLINGGRQRVQCAGSKQYRHCKVKPGLLHRIMKRMLITLCRSRRMVTVHQTMGKCFAELVI